MNSEDDENNPRVQLLKQMPRNAVAAEIGAWKGDFSELILSRTDPKTLHLVDPWLFQPEFSERMYGGSVAKSQLDMDEIYNSVAARFGGDGRVKLDRGKSAEVLQQFPDGYFDWVYIDGNHYYDYVSEDLSLSRKKVKPGGFITGDDYNWGTQNGHPVKQAIQDFVKREKLVDQLTVINSQYLIKL